MAELKFKHGTVGLQTLCGVPWNPSISTRPSSLSFYLALGEEVSLFSPRPTFLPLPVNPVPSQFMLQSLFIKQPHSVMHLTVSSFSLCINLCHLAIEIRGHGACLSPLSLCFSGTLSTLQILFYY